MAQFGADLVFNPGVEEDEQGFTAKQAKTVDSPWEHVSEPMAPSDANDQRARQNASSYSADPNKMLATLTTGRAARRVHLSTQSFNAQPEAIVSREEGRAWIMVYNDGANDAWIAENDSQLSVTPPYGWHLASGAAIVLTTEDQIFAVAPSGNTNLCIAVGEN